MRRAGQGGIGDVLAELQHDEAGELVGGVFLAAPDRNLQDVEHRMRHFMQHDLDEGAGDRRLPRHAGVGLVLGG